MRTLAFILLVAFATAVVLPNDIGTHNLPATKCKCVKAKRHHQIAGKVLAWVNSHQMPGDLNPTGGTHVVVCRSVPSFANTPLSTPLRI